MDGRGKVTMKFEKNGENYTHTFIIGGSLKRQIIIGRDFLIKKTMTVGWDYDKNGKPIKVLKDQVGIIAKSPEHGENTMLCLKRAITVPPRHAVVTEVTCKDILAGQHIIVPDSSFEYENPNLKFKSMCYDNPEEMAARVLPIILKKTLIPVNTSIYQQILIASTKPEKNKVAYTEIAEIENLTKTVEEECRNWLPKKKMSTDFMISPMDFDEHRQVDIPKGQYSKEAKIKLYDIL